jgi:hypothetical protein
MAGLKTDYKDDVLDTTQNTKRKYQMIDNGDGTVSFEDVTEYLQQGDNFGADDINDTNEEVNIINDKLTCEEYSASASGMGNVLEEYISQANMEVGETRRVDIYVTSSSLHSHYITEITKTKNYSNEDVYSGLILGNTDIANRRNFLKIGSNAIQVLNITPLNRQLISVPTSPAITYADALTQIYAVYSTLSDAEKRNSRLYYGSYVLNLLSTGDGRYTGSWINSSNKSTLFDFSVVNKTAKAITDGTYSDRTNTNIASAIALWSF